MTARTIDLKGELLVAVTVALSIGQMSAAPQTVSPGASDVSSEVVILDGPPTLSRMELLYRLKSSSMKSVAIVKVFPTEATAGRIMPGKGHSDVTETDWLQEYRALIKMRLDMGEIIKVGPDVIVRVSNGSTVEGRVLAGKNPLVCSSSLLDCNIVWITVKDTPPLFRGKSRDPLIHVFVNRHNLPSQTEATRISKILQGRFRTNLFEVSFRRDDYFPTDTDFPIRYPFFLGRQPVEPKNAHESDEVTCATLGQNLRCGQ